eukprot:5502729-Amphidinium_carterae.1
MRADNVTLCMCQHSLSPALVGHTVRLSDQSTKWVIVTDSLSLQQSRTWGNATRRSKQRYQRVICCFAEWPVLGDTMSHARQRQDFHPECVEGLQHNLALLNSHEA